MRETKHRSIVKGLSWRVIASIATMGIVFLATGNITLTFGAGLIDILIKFLFYYVHERGWQKINWGIK